MRFNLTVEQLDFQSSLNRSLTRHFPAADLRAIWDAPDTRTDELRKLLAGMGVLGILVPEEFGGTDASEVELVLALEEMGYHGVTLPVLESAGVAASTLARFGPEPNRRAWLPKIASGDATLTILLDGSGLAVQGQQADAVIVRDGNSLHIVGAESVRWREIRTEDPTRRLAVAESVTLDDHSLIDPTGGAAERALAVARMGTAAQLLGLSNRLVQMTRDYVLERNQFGRPIGSFQALKHQLADAAVAVEASRGLVWYAAYCLASERAESSIAVMTAKSSASSAAAKANAVSLQLHGGIGYTWEHDLHLWLKRGKAWEQAYGDGGDLRAGLGRLLLNAPSEPIVAEGEGAP